jgi:ATP-binding cassette subfamily B (MDR/TAP) protein 6
VVALNNDWYWLYNPLTAFTLLYRPISQSLVDAERLLNLLSEPSEVRDKPDAKELVVTDAVIEFGILFHD